MRLLFQFAFVKLQNRGKPSVCIQKLNTHANLCVLYLVATISSCSIIYTTVLRGRLYLAYYRSYEFMATNKCQLLILLRCHDVKISQQTSVILPLTTWMGAVMHLHIQMIISTSSQTSINVCSNWISTELASSHIHPTDTSCGDSFSIVDCGFEMVYHCTCDRYQQFKGFYIRACCTMTAHLRNKITNQKVIFKLPWLLNSCQTWETSFTSVGKCCLQFIQCRMCIIRSQIWQCGWNPTCPVCGWKRNDRYLYVTITVNTNCYYFFMTQYKFFCIRTEWMNFVLYQLAKHCKRKLRYSRLSPNSPKPPDVYTDCDGISKRRLKHHIMHAI